MAKMKPMPASALYVDAVAPWKLRGNIDRAVELQSSCTIALNLFRQLAIYLAPVLPSLQRQTEDLFGQPIKSWTAAATPVVDEVFARWEAEPVAPLESFAVSSLRIARIW